MWAGNNNEYMEVDVVEALHLKETITPEEYKVYNELLCILSRNDAAFSVQVITYALSLEQSYKKQEK